MKTYALMYESYDSFFDPPRFAICSKKNTADNTEIFNEHTISIMSSSYTENKTDISNTLNRLGFNNVEIVEL